MLMNSRLLYAKHSRNWLKFCPIVSNKLDFSANKT